MNLIDMRPSIFLKNIKVSELELWFMVRLLIKLKMFYSIVIYVHLYLKMYEYNCHAWQYNVYLIIIKKNSLRL